LGDTAGGPFAAATGLGFAGFFFPPLNQMLRMGGHSAVREQRFQSGGRRSALLVFAIAWSSE
jgi:hypothetical protein